MKQKAPYLPAVLAFCVAVAALCTVLLVFIGRSGSERRLQSEAGGQLVALSRAAQLAQELGRHPGDTALQDQLNGQLAQIEPARVRLGAGDAGLFRLASAAVLLAAGLSIAFMLLFYLFVLFRIIRPFQRLENFAGAVAAGDLDLPLRMERGGVFGAFSWAFDLMRTELKKARAAEEEARAAQKTLVAAISHDIKTPVASIRAYAEALAGGTAAAPQRQAKYLAVIQRKADEVAALTDDLFLHAVSDIDRLSVEPEDCAAPALMEELLDPFLVQHGEAIQIEGEVPAVTVRADRRRLAQAFENIVANTEKYAGDFRLRIRFSIENGFLVCGLEDFGGGIPPQDLPFAQEKFYRGTNAKGRKGVGLGLYIVRYIMEKSGGFLTLENTGRGLLTRLGIKLSGI